MSVTRTHFTTRLGVIAATVGSAVGLGNIWRFPYEAGTHGGGAFLLVDLFFIFIIGIPVMCAEFVIGRHTGSNIRGAFRKLAPGKSWGYVSFIGITASLLILSFYSVVAGWTMRYTFASLCGFGTDVTPEGLHREFEEFSANPMASVGWTIVFLLLNYFILARGIRNGIEKISNILMPVLFLILIGCTINSLMMPAAAEGVSFLLKPDFSEITPEVVLSAMGQAFFTLSLGLGCLITYSSYFPANTPLVRTSFTIAALDTLVAVLAGLIIFPAVFTFGQEPAAGPRLVFEVLPSIFSHIAGGMIWSTIFFFLLLIASLTSTISMAEITIAYQNEEFGISRRQATTNTIAFAMVMGSLCALSFGPLRHLTVGSLRIFDLFDFVSSNILLPAGGMIISLFVGWILDRAVLKSELSTGRRNGVLNRALVSCIVFSLRWLAPACIALVFLAGLGLFDN